MVYGSIYESSRLDSHFLPEYASSDAPFRMVTESLATDQALFDIIIEHDFLEAAASYDVQLESTLEAIDEGFLGDLWSKIIELLNKIRDKIVSIFKAAQVRIGAFFTKDNKALVDKYQKQFNNAKTDKITIKGFRTKKSDVTKSLNIDYLRDKFEDACNAATKDAAETAKKEGTVEKCLKDITGKSSTESSFTSDLRDACYNGVRDVKASAIANYVSETLIKYGEADTALKKLKTDLDSAVTTSIEKADNAQKEYEKNLTKDGSNPYKSGEGDNATEDTTRKELDQARAAAAKSIATAEQGAVGKAFSGFLDLLKFDMKQCRKAYITIAAKGAPGVTKESADLADEEIGLVDYEVDSFFEQDSYDEDELTA